MKTYREELWFQTDIRRACLNITSQVEEAVHKSGIRDGMVLINAMISPPVSILTKTSRAC